MITFWKGPFLLVLLLTLFFIFAIFTLDKVVAQELFPQADLAYAIFLISLRDGSACAHQLLFFTISFTPGQPDLAAAVQAFVGRIAIHALTRWVTSASMVIAQIAAFMFPKRLILAKLRISCLLSCSFPLKLSAAIGDLIVVIAPASQVEAVGFAPIYIGSSALR